MKNLVILIISLIIHSFGYSQIITDVEEISPFYEELSAVKKGDQWAFINRKGVTVINYRNDLVSSKNEIGIASDSYPVFKEGRCLIKKLIDGVYLYGYIDKNGKEIIAPQYINATNFKDGSAIVMDAEKVVIGFNAALDKDIVSNTLKEYIINTSGEVVLSLDNARNYIKPKDKTKGPPAFYSKFIAPHLIAVKTTDEPKYNIYKF